MVTTSQLRSSNPENSISYFKSPISTLLESVHDTGFLHVSSHDLLEAYCVFSSRIQAIAPILSEGEVAFPAVQYLKDNSTGVVACLRRDIHRAFIDPFSNSQCNGLSLPSMPWSRGVTDDDMKYAKDLSTVCQYALQLLSNIFKLRALSSAFSLDSLAGLLDDVLAIVTSSSLPTLNASKARAMGIWILSTLSIPASVLSSRRIQLCSAVKSIIASEEMESGISDGLKALRTILSLNAPEFLAPSEEILPFVFSRITSPMQRVRQGSARTLGVFVLSLLSQLSNARERPQLITTTITHTFIRTSVKHARPETGLGPEIQELIFTALRSQLLEEQTWAFVIVACLIVLSDADVFLHPHTLRLVLNSLSKVSGRGRSVIRAIHACVWRCLIWSFSRIGYGDSFTVDGEVMAIEKLVDLRGRALRVVKQERRNGIGAMLIAHLLSTTSDSGAEMSFRRERDIMEAIEVTKEMVEDEDHSVHLEGRAILIKLISAIGSSSAGSPDLSTDREYPWLSRELFDGTILDADQKQLVQLIPAITKSEIRYVRSLTEAEILQCWEELLGVWIHCIRREFLESKNAFAINDELLRVWQVLLLVQAQLTQEYCNFTSSQEFSERIIDIFTEIVHLGSHTHSATEVSPNIPLLLIERLWVHMKNIFHASWLARTSGQILAMIVCQPRDWTCEELNMLWSTMYPSLVSPESRHVFVNLLVCNDRQKEAHDRRRSWQTLAKAWQSLNPMPEWKHSTLLLTHAFGPWSMSEEEKSLWELLLRFTIQHAVSDAVRPLIVLETLSTLLSEQSEQLARRPEIVSLLLKHCDLTDAEPIPTTFLSQCNRTLYEMYSSRSDLVSAALEKFRQLPHMLTHCPKNHLVAVVSLLSDGLCVWIRDDQNFVPEQEYNDIIIAVYQTTLHNLRDITITPDILRTLTPFICSAFGNIPSPALGPAAFKEFWDYIWPRLRLLNYKVSPEIKQVLIPCYEIFGCSIPSDISAESQSQTQEESFVPETPQWEEDAHLIDTNFYVSSPLSHSATGLPSMLDISPRGATSQAAEQETHSSPSRSKDDILSPEVPSAYPHRRPRSEPEGRDETHEWRADDRSSDLSFFHATNQRTVASDGIFSPAAPRPSSTEAKFELPCLSHRAHSEDILNPSHSLYLPSSPTMGKQVIRNDLTTRSSHHEAGIGKLNSRPLKRQRLATSSSPPVDSIITDLDGHASERTTSTLKPTRTMSHPPNVRWRLAYVEVPTYRSIRRQHRQSILDEERSPSLHRQSSGDMSSQPDDYDIWETSIDPRDVQQMQRELVHNESDDDWHEAAMFEDGPSSSQLPSDEPLPPSMRRGTLVTRGPHAPPGPRTPPSLPCPSPTDPQRSRAADAGETVIPSSQDEENAEDISIFSHPALTNIQHPPPSLRSQTAPACAPSRSAAHFPLAGASGAHHRRARTATVTVTSARLAELQRVRDALRLDGSQMPVDEVLEAAKLVNEIDGVLKESLMKRFGAAARAVVNRGDEDDDAARYSKGTRRAD